MITDKILFHLKNIEEEVSLVRDLLFCPDGIRIVAAWREDLSYVEYRYNDMPPRIMFLTDNKCDEMVMQQYIFDAVGAIPPSACGRENVEICSDIPLEKLSRGVQMAAEVFEIKVSEINHELLSQIKERHDFNNHMSQLKNSQRAAEESPELCGDVELPDTGSEA